jgi:hypothetical protein
LLSKAVHPSRVGGFFWIVSRRVEAGGSKLVVHPSAIGEPAPNPAQQLL